MLVSFFSHANVLIHDFFFEPLGEKWLKNTKKNEEKYANFLHNHFSIFSGSCFLDLVSYSFTRMHKFHSVGLNSIDSTIKGFHFFCPGPKGLYTDHETKRPEGQLLAEHLMVNVVSLSPYLPKSRGGGCWLPLPRSCKADGRWKILYCDWVCTKFRHITLVKHTHTHKKKMNTSKEEGKRGVLWRSKNKWSWASKKKRKKREKIMALNLIPHRHQEFVVGRLSQQIIISEGNFPPTNNGKALWPKHRYNLQVPPFSFGGWLCFAPTYTRPSLLQRSYRALISESLDRRKSNWDTLNPAKKCGGASVQHGISQNHHHHH
jgi:hypothetical protein